MTINDVCAILKEKNNFEILTHASPDGDTLGCGYALCLALRAMGKKANVITEAVPEKFLYISKTAGRENFEPAYIVSTDIAADSLLGSNTEKYCGKINLCIDHHGSNSLTAEKKYVDSTAAAACEIIYEIINNLGTELTKEMADCLYTGISTDTGCFKFTNTTAKTHRIAAALMEAGCDYSRINKVMFDTKSRGRLALEHALYDTMEYTADDRCAIMCITLRMLEALHITHEDTEGIEAIPRQIEGVRIGITMKEKEDGAFKISVRTNEDVNAAEFCKQFGGGGHAAAAGCRIEGKQEEIKQILMKAAEQIL